MSKIRQLLRSRKFWASVAGVVIVVCEALIPEFPLSPEAVQKIVLALAAYVIGTGLDDSGIVRKA